MDVLALAMAKAYTDKKGGYTETKRTVIVPETTTLFNESYLELHLDPTASLIVGETYIAVFDGVEYECEAYLESVNEIPCLGNASFTDGADTGNGEPFGVADWGGGQIDVGVARKSGSHTISVYQRKEIVHPIDPKYLPGAVLPVVELETVIRQEGTTLAEVDCAKLDEIANSFLPAILKFNYEEFMDIVAVVNVCVGMDGTSGSVSVTFSQVAFTFTHHDGVWAVECN